MKYYFNKKITGSFEEAIQRVTSALNKEGFGLLTEIDITATLKKKLGVGFYNYKILGACNPSFAYNALLAEDKIGTMLPCNNCTGKKPGKVEVSAINPAASMKLILNKDLHRIATEVKDKLKKVIKEL
ncbi:DUF302 domain-containing protein [Mucilaginibacter sp. P25]|uniref:DUF302 domain-containing protein n=1 Tax=unclassified Mucilaginibacter TaxID=2617802 RepID=UPI003D664AED